MNMFHFLVLLLLSIYCASAEVFSAINDMKKLLDTQSAVIADLPNYIEKRKLKIAHLENQLQILRKQHEVAMKNLSDYIENPLNAFKLIKSLAHDLRAPGEPADCIGDYMKYLNNTSPHLAIPNRDDLIGAARALVRLQKTYKLDVSELAKGILKDSYGSPMTAEDCFVIGRIIYKAIVGVTYADAIPWFKEALRKYKKGDTGNLTQVEILEYIAYSYYKLDQFQSAINWSLKVLVLEPKNEKIHRNILYYFKRIAEIEDKQYLKGEIKKPGAAPPKVNGNYSSGYNVKHYAALCRGEYQLNRDITKRLFCWYSSKHHPFLKLAPIKVEQVYIEPDVFIFHQVISDDEIQQVKEMAKPKFDRAGVSSASGRPMTALYRICKTSWLRDEDSSVVGRITRRVADITGLSMDSAEQLQVADYGIGGQYDPHFDFSEETERSYGSNRIATVLFYMSDVAQGGATVFTELGLSVFPIKNAALYWLNLHPSGEGNPATIHAACPVLRGSKWVANKWIHQKGQEFIRPCNLEYQPKALLQSFPIPLPKTFI